MSSNSGFSGIVKRISSMLARRKLVGRDSAGNQYFKKLEYDMSGENFERRTMVPGNRLGLLEVYHYMEPQ